MAATEDQTAGPDNATRIGAVSFLNTRPLIEGVEKIAGLELILDAPAALLDRLLAGEVDVALAPVIDAPRSARALALLPVGCIASSAETMTVRLISRVPFEEIESVHVDSDSHTSVALLKVILDRLVSRRPESIAFDALATRAEDQSAWPEAMLLIGDKVVSAGFPESVFPHRLDLGKAWRELFDLPFVYAAWMCDAERAEEAVVRRAARLLDRQRRHNATRLDWIAVSRAPDHGWSAPDARAYLTGLLRYELDEPAQRAVETFLRAAADLDLAPRREIRWAGEVLA